MFICCGVTKARAAHALRSPSACSEAKAWVCAAQVYGLPTIILFREGRMVEGSHKEGAIGKAALLKYLDQHGVVPAAAKNAAPA